MKKKPRKKPSLYLMYAAVASVFIAISVFIVLSASGYEIKLGNKEITIEETGMIIISSKPSGASIYIDGDKSDQKTNLLFSVKLDKIHKGKYTVRLEKEGFYSWEKEVEVFPEIVTWANYVLLFPKEPKIEKNVFTGDIKDSLVSEDRKKSIILSESKADSFIYLLNNESGKYDKVFDTSDMKLKKKISMIHLLKLSKDGNTLLLSGKIGGKTKTFYLDTTSEGERGMNAVSPMRLEHVTFNDVADKEVFGTKGGELFRLSLNTGSMSTSLERNVVQAFSVDDQVYYIKSSGGKGSLWQMHSDTNGKKIICDDVPVSTGYSISISDKDKNVALLTAEKKLYLLKKSGNKYISHEEGDKVSNFEWSPDGVRLFFQTEEKIYVLDQDVDKTFEIKNKGQYKNLMWYDSRHLLGQKGLKGVVMDFDGTNTISLGKVIDGTQISFSPRNKDIFFFSSLPRKAQFTLNRYQTEF